MLRYVCRGRRDGPEGEPAPAPAHQRRDEAKRGEGVGEAGKACRPKAHRGEQRDRLRAFGQPAEIVEALGREFRRLQPARAAIAAKARKLLPVPTKASSSAAAASALRAGSANAKPSGDQRVEEEIERDVEKGAAIGRPERRASAPSRPSASAIDEDQRQRDPVVAERDCAAPPPTPTAKPAIVTASALTPRFASSAARGSSARRNDRLQPGVEHALNPSTSRTERRPTSQRPGGRVRAPPLPGGRPGRVAPAGIGMDRVEDRLEPEPVAHRRA